jgi:hypothetical protein
MYRKFSSRSSSAISFVAKARTRDFRRRWNWQRRSGPGIRREYRAAPAYHGLEMEVKGRREVEDTRLSGTSGTWHVFVRPGRRITWARFGRPMAVGRRIWVVFFGVLFFERCMIIPVFFDQVRVFFFFFSPMYCCLATGNPQSVLVSKAAGNGHDISLTHPPEPPPLLPTVQFFLSRLSP